MTMHMQDATAFPPHVGHAVAALSGYLEVSAGRGHGVQRAAAASARAELLDAHPLAAPMGSTTFTDPGVAWRGAVAALRSALASSADPVETVHLASAVEIVGEVAAPR